MMQEIQQKFSEKGVQALTPEEKRALELFGRRAERLQIIQEQSRAFENVPDAVYQLKITLQGSKPPIWRRFLLKNTITLGTLHSIIQIVMGWEDCHLYEFERGKRPYTISYREPFEDEPFGDCELDPERDVHDTHLKEVMAEEKQKLTYLYDMGDSWEHTLLLEKILPLDKQLAVHPVCIKAKGACPPEDFGGIWAYQDFLETAFDKKHPEYKYAQERLKEWFGGTFDPNAYNIEDVNRQLKRIKQ